MRRVAVIGAGPGGLMVAEVLAARGFKVDVYDQRPSPARKFLMAGRGGLNITHSEPFEQFISRYGEATDFLRPALEAFSPADLRAWCEGLGEETFVGSSGRVFPKSFKASPLLRAWLARLNSLGVSIHYNFKWQGETLDVDYTILSLGGASWPRLGSDGHWTDILRAKGVEIVNFRPANCGFLHQWSDVFQDKFAGQPLKSIGLSHDGKSLIGEAMISKLGIEGSVIYALSKSLRQAIERQGKAMLFLDFKPDTSLEKLTDDLSKGRGRDSFSNYLRKSIHLSSVAIGLLQEDREVSQLSVRALAELIKAYEIELTGTAGLERAISSAGGIALHEVDANFQLKKWPGVYAIGEMLDWEAPTGGYLLQATFSMAVYLGRSLG